MCRAPLSLSDGVLAALDTLSARYGPMRSRRISRLRCTKDGATPTVPAGAALADQSFGRVSAIQLRGTDTAQMVQKGQIGRTCSLQNVTVLLSKRLQASACCQARVEQLCDQPHLPAYEVTQVKWAWSHLSVRQYTICQEHEPHLFTWSTSRLA